MQGHNYITESSISNVIEQFVRVIVILVGCILVIKVFHLDEKIAIGIAVFSAAISAFASYLYLKYKMFRNKDQFNSEHTIKDAEKKITGKMTVVEIMLQKFNLLAKQR